MHRSPLSKVPPQTSPSLGRPRERHVKRIEQKLRKFEWRCEPPGFGDLASRKLRQRSRFRALLIEADDAYRAAIIACMRLADCSVNDVTTIPLGLAALDRARYDVIVWGVPVPTPERRRASIAELKLKTDAPLVLLASGFEMAQLDLEAGADQWMPKPFVPGALVGAGSRGAA